MAGAGAGSDVVGVTTSTIVNTLIVEEPGVDASAVAGWASGGFGRDDPDVGLGDLDGLEIELRGDGGQPPVAGAAVGREDLAALDFGAGDGDTRLGKGDGMASRVGDVGVASRGGGVAVASRGGRAGVGRRAGADPVAAVGGSGSGVSSGRDSADRGGQPRSTARKIA